MQAFKAANPGSTLIDFIQWHSPKDIIVDDEGKVLLSERMRGESVWSELWEEATPLPAHLQPPLFSPWREAEKSIFYFEDLSLNDLLSQLLSYSDKVFDFQAEEQALKDSLLVPFNSHEEVLMAAEDERDAVQHLFRLNISGISVVEQCFVLGGNKMVVVDGVDGREYVASVKNVTSK
jgi:hypothetical protein